jgi:putative exosortase-associated protein (TIGR04073 family)
MAKKAIFLLVIVAMIAGIAAPAYCDDPLKKLGRGTANVLTCPLELFLQPSRVNNTDGPVAGFTYGIIKGVAMMGLRAIVGAYEIISFPVPIPKDYGPILKDPEFFFEDMNW